MKHNINQHFSNAKKTHPWNNKGGKNQNIETELKELREVNGEKLSGK